MASQTCYTFTVFTVLLIISIQCGAQLSTTFYGSTCPNALSTIQAAIRTAVSRDFRMAASLIRLHFHDCFVQGCDGSILLNDPSTSERTAQNNLNSVRGFEVIDNAKAQVEGICPGVVSCADILAVAARDASFAVGGPWWPVKLGRRDSTTASLTSANSDLPGAEDSLDSLVSLFGRKGLSARDMVALTGAHTIGQARCLNFRGRIYNNASDIDAGFAATLRGQCPVSTDGNANLVPLDETTPFSFDNTYFNNLIQKKGVLASDRILFSGASTASIVDEYSNNPTKFTSDFSAAMIKMGDISPLTGSQGEIRKLCYAIN